MSELNNYPDNIVHQWKRERDEAIEILRYYAAGNTDLEIQPKFQSIWNDPKQWIKRSMSHWWSGRKAREFLAAIAKAEGGSNE